MHKGIYVAGVVAAIVLVTGLGACTAPLASSFEDDVSVSEKINSVRLNSDSGAVMIRGTEGVSTVLIHRRVEYRTSAPSGPTHQVDGGVLLLNGCGRSCSVIYTVELPAGLPITGKTSSGKISLSGVGAVDVSTNSGDIRLDGVAGMVNAETDNGKITGRDLLGSIQAKTDNGAIDLAPGSHQDIRAETSNGAVTVVVPDGKYRVSAETDNGETDVQVPHDPAGDHQLELITDNGAISLKIG